MVRSLCKGVAVTYVCKNSILDVLVGYKPLLRFPQVWFFPAAHYMLRVNNRNIRARCEICSKLTIKTPDQRQWRRSGVFTINLEHISHLFVFLSLTMSR